tara:strand:+ start:3006 stop:3302 length:297 start_codon:yes stop_codon:yes gene_type:complete
MPMPKGKKFKFSYATVSDDERSANYRTISKIMTENGYKMNHASARNYILKIMKQFAKNIALNEGIRLSDERLGVIAKNPNFQSAVGDLVQNEIYNINK